MIEIIPYSDEYKQPTINLILGILEGEFGWDHIRRPDLQQIPYVYQKGKSNFWIAIDGKDVVGTIALVDYGKNRYYLKRMYVQKNHRSTGLAKKLLDTAIEFALKNHFKKIFLGTSPQMTAAIKFYEKTGFQKTNYLPKGMPDFGDTVFYELKL